MKNLLLTVLLAVFSLNAFAQVQIQDPWVRATVPYQKATGVFMLLHADKDIQLVQASSPLAAVGEIHEMKMQDNVMKMRQIDGLSLSAGKPIALKPGGFHIMLMGLQRQVKEGELVPLVLTFEAADGSREQIRLDAPVRSLTATAGSGNAKH